MATQAADLADANQLRYRGMSPTLVELQHPSLSNRALAAAREHATRRCLRAEYVALYAGPPTMALAISAAFTLALRHAPSTHVAAAMTLTIIAAFGTLFGPSAPRLRMDRAAARHDAATRATVPAGAAAAYRRIASAYDDLRADSTHPDRVVADSTRALNGARKLVYLVAEHWLRGVSPAGRRGGTCSR